MSISQHGWLEIFEHSHSLKELESLFEHSIPLSGEPSVAAAQAG